MWQSSTHTALLLRHFSDTLLIERRTELLIQWATMSINERLRLQTTTPDIEEDVEEDILTGDDNINEELWRVVIHNDNFTPMNFVIYVLVKIFEKPVIFAEGIMWQAHSEGNAVVEALPKEEATRRVNKAMFAARLEGYPLKLTVEPN